MRGRASWTVGKLPCISAGLNTDSCCVTTPLHLPLPKEGNFVAEGSLISLRPTLHNHILFTLSEAVQLSGHHGNRDRS